MKVLIVAESEQIINKYDTLLKNNGYDVITYTWILKALDNIEEIKPDIIFISIVDYPRQWKVFVNYVQTMFGNDSPDIYIVGKNELSEKEINDINLLNCKQFSDESVLVVQSEVKSTLGIEEPTPAVSDIVNEFTFHHPKTNEVISGKIKNYNDPMFLYIPDLKTNLKMLRFGMRINNAIFSLDNVILDVNVQIQGINEDSIEMCILGINEKK